MGSVGVVLFPSKHKPYRLYCPVNRIFSHSYSFTYRVHFLQEQDTSLSLCKLLSDCYRCVITEHISDKRFSLSSASWSYIRDSRLFDTCNIPCLYCKKQHHDLFSFSFFRTDAAKFISCLYCYKVDIILFIALHICRDCYICYPEEE